MNRNSTGGFAGWAVFNLTKPSPVMVVTNKRRLQFLWRTSYMYTPSITIRRYIETNIARR